MKRIVSRGNTLTTTEYYERRLKERRKKIYIGCGIFAVLLVGLILLARLRRLEIASVQVFGTDALTADAVKAAADGRLNGSYAWLLPKRNFALYPGTGIRAALASQFPRFSSVDLSLEGVKTLDVSVTERKPYALYCNQDASCYFLDDAGFIFSAAPVFSEGVYFVYAKDATTTEPLGTALLPPAEFTALSSFIESLGKLAAASKVEPREAVISGQGADISLSTGAHVLVNRAADLPKLASDLAAFLKTPEVTAAGDFWNKISSLDLRTENKIFYVFKQ